MKKVTAAIGVMTSCLLAASVPPASASTLINNGSFETGDFTGWTTGGNFEDTEVVTGAFYEYSGAQDGNYYAVLGPVDSPGTLSQAFTDTAGQLLQFSYWFNAVGDDPSEFSVSFDGNTLQDLIDPSTSNVWTHYTFGVTATGSDNIVFSFQDNPAYMALDNVSVSAVSATPLPAALPLFATGLGALGLLGWRRKRKASAAVAG